MASNGRSSPTSSGPSWLKSFPPGLSGPQASDAAAKPGRDQSPRNYGFTAAGLGILLLRVHQLSMHGAPLLPRQYPQLIDGATWRPGASFIFTLIFAPWALRNHRTGVRGGR